MTSTIDERHADSLQRLRTITSRDPERMPGTPLGESLERLAKAGDMEAAMARYALNSPSRRIWDILFREAVKFRDDWRETPKGFIRDENAEHETPDDLVVWFTEAAESDPDAALSREALLEIGRLSLEEQIREQTEAKVAAGELVRALNEDGEIVFRGPVQ